VPGFTPLVPGSIDDLSYAPFVEKRGNLIVGAGLMAFPVFWGILVWGQLAYFGPMRSLFTKITRRYLDTLPFGWGLFDILFYLLPLVGATLIATGFVVKGDRRPSHLLIAALAGVIIVVVVRKWSPGYL
jgi:hypothetical protein